MQNIQGVVLDGLTFDASFDSGNMARVEQEADDEYNLWTRADMEGTDFENKNRTWWSFSVKGASLSGRIIHFNIYNMNAQGKLFRADMRPVYRVWPSQPEWARIPVQCTHSGTKEDDNFALRFRHKFEVGTTDTIYFAFCFPLTYADSIARLAWLDALFGLPAAQIAASTTPTGGATSSTTTTLSRPASKEEAGREAASVGLHFMAAVEEAAPAATAPVPAAASAPLPAATKSVKAPKGSGAPSGAPPLLARAAIRRTHRRRAAAARQDATVVGSNRGRASSARRSSK